MPETRLMEPVWETAPDSESLAHRLAGYVAGELRRALEHDDQVVLAVSGGRSPVAFFEALAEQALDWHRVVVVPVDERIVAPDSSDANALLIREHLLRERAANAVFRELTQAGEGPALPGPPAVAVFGMGTDGHTASWFPEDAASLRAMNEAETPAVVGTQAPEAPQQRLTWNWPALSRAHQRLLLIHGEDKRRLLEYIVSHGPGVKRYPVARLLTAPLTVFWSP